MPGKDVTLKIQNGNIQNAAYENDLMHYEYDRAKDGKYDLKIGNPPKPYSDAPRQDEMGVLNLLKNHLVNLSDQSGNVMTVTTDGKAANLNYEKSVDYVDDKIAELTLAQSKKKGTEVLEKAKLENLKELATLIIKYDTSPFDSSKKDGLNGNEIKDIKNQATKYGFTIGELKTGSQEVDIFSDKNKEHLVGTIKVKSIEPNVRYTD